MTFEGVTMANVNYDSHNVDGDLDPEFDADALVEDGKDLSDPANLAEHLDALEGREPERTDLSAKDMDEALRRSGE